MLSEAQNKLIAKLLRIPEADYLAAVKDPAEKDISIPEKLTVLNEAELTNLKNNEYKAGKDKGVEMAVKEYKEETGLDFTGKTIEGLVKAAAAKAITEAKIPADERVATLTQDLEDVRKNFKAKDAELLAKDALVTKAITEAELYRAFPSLGEGQIGVDKVITLMKADGYDFNMDNGTLIVKKGGEIIKDAISKPLPVKDVITTYAKESNIYKEPTVPPIGREGNDGKSKVVFTKMSELKAHFESQGKNMNGSEARNTVQQLKKDNPDFDMQN